MKTLIRIEEIKINGIKNVLHGEIKFNEYANFLKGDFNRLKSVLGIYGPNGSGKTTVLETTKLLREILLGKKISNEFVKLINNSTNQAEISYTFFINLDHITQLITYIFKISYIDGQYDIVSEKLVAKEYENEKNRWKPQVTLFEVESGNIIIKKIANKFTKENLIEMRVTKDIEKGASFIFNKRNRDIIVNELHNKEENKLIEVVRILPFYAETNLIIIENDFMGSINLNSFVPINVYLEDMDEVKIGRITLNLLEPNLLSNSMFDIFKKVIHQIDLVLNAIIPSINIVIVNEKEQLTSKGERGVSFEIASKRSEKPIPLKYESEGIKRIISVTSSMIAAFNNSSICLMIDEFDSGIFEYLLGELIEIIDESAKGQFVFTSHNLRALEKLSYKSIFFTTTNPNNRYIQLTGIKPNNNVRDYYYKNILLGGQSEPVYEETKSYNIKRAFRKAGKLNG